MLFFSFRFPSSDPFFYRSSVDSRKRDRCGHGRPADAHARPGPLHARSARRLRPRRHLSVQQHETPGRGRDRRHDFPGLRDELPGAAPLDPRERPKVPPRPPRPLRSHQAAAHRCGPDRRHLRDHRGRLGRRGGQPAHREKIRDGGERLGASAEGLRPGLERGQLAFRPGDRRVRHHAGAPGVRDAAGGRGLGGADGGRHDGDGRRSVSDDLHREPGRREWRGERGFLRGDHLRSLHALCGVAVSGGDQRSLPGAASAGGDRPGNRLAGLHGQRVVVSERKDEVRRSGCGGGAADGRRGCCYNSHDRRVSVD
mmetsp:Transcript_6091/g.13101  ORF Transcript_6091/g.13101 Transcript_6091/m.13101 type:complete len:312 (+) Transcript_6091:333-1268(+)